MPKSAAPAQGIKSAIGKIMDSYGLDEFEQARAFIYFLGSVYSPHNAKIAQWYSDVLLARYVEAKYYSGNSLTQAHIGKSQFLRPSSILRAVTSDDELAFDISLPPKRPTPRRFVADIVRAFISSGDEAVSLNKIRRWASQGRLYGHSRVGKTEFDDRWRKYKDVCCILVVNEYPRGRIADSGFTLRPRREWQEARRIWREANPGEIDGVEQALSELRKSYDTMIEVLAGPPPADKRR